MYLIFLVLTIIIGCQGPDIKQIIIIINKAEDYHKKDTLVIRDANTLKLIDGLIHDKKKEPLKYMITYHLDIVYNDGSIKKYYGQGRWIRIEKDSYKGSYKGSYTLPSDERLEKFLKIVKQR